MKPGDAVLEMGTSTQEPNGQKKQQPGPLPGQSGQSFPKEIATNQRTVKIDDKRVLHTRGSFGIWLAHNRLSRFTLGPISVTSAHANADRA